MKKRIRSSRRPKRRGIAVIVSLLLLMLVTVGGTLAYLVEKDAPITNVFSPANVDCEVEEVLSDNNTKTSITVKNTGDIDAYIRLQFISYRIDDNGNVIGGETAVDFNLNSDDWIKVTDPTTQITHYYYTKRVPINGVTSNIIAPGSSIVMQDYTLMFDAAGNKSGDMAEGKQVIEVIAEAIQADGVTSADPTGIPAVTAAWKIEVDGSGNLKAPTSPTSTTN